MLLQRFSVFNRFRKQNTFLTYSREIISFGNDAPHRVKLGKFGAHRHAAYFSGKIFPRFVRTLVMRGKSVRGPLLIWSRIILYQLITEVFLKKYLKQNRISDISGRTDQKEQISDKEQDVSGRTDIRQRMIPWSSKLGVEQ